MNPLKYLGSGGSKLITALCALLVSFVLISGTTFSWYTGADVVVNNFKSQQLVFSTGITEQFDQKKPFDYKAVAAQNTGNVDAFVRILVQPVILSADGEPLPANIGDQVLIYYDSSVTPPDVPGPSAGDLGYNTADWQDGQDGYYYYLHKLDPGATTPYLITRVALSDEAMNDPAYQGATLSVYIQEDGLWAYGDFETAWWGAPGEPSDSTLAGIYHTLLSSLSV